MTPSTCTEPLTAVSNPPVEALESNLLPTDVMRRSATTTCRRRPAADQGRQAHRRLEVHRLQGLPVGLHRVERHRIRRSRRTSGPTRTRTTSRPRCSPLMRFTEYENPETSNLEWLIRKDGCMHCEDPGCLKACPAPGAIVQYSNGIVDFIHENCIGCGYCVSGCPFDIPRISQGHHTRLQVHALLRPGGGGRGAGLRQGLPDPVHHLRAEGRADRARRGADRRPEEPRLRERRALRSAGRRRHARDVRAAPRRQAGDLCRTCRPIRGSRRWSRRGRA